MGSQLEQITVRKEAASENHDTNRPDGDSVVYSPVNHRTDSIFQRLILDQSILRDRVLFTYFLLFDSISLHDSKSFKELAAGIGVELAFESACRPGSTSFQRAFSIVKSRLYAQGSIENSFAFETSRLFGGFCSNSTCSERCCCFFARACEGAEMHASVYGCILDVEDDENVFVKTRTRINRESKLRSKHSPNTSESRRTSGYGVSRPHACHPTESRRCQRRTTRKKRTIKPEIVRNT